MAGDGIDSLDTITHELRSAAAVALEVGSWFAPTLDDCCVEAERLVGIVADQRPVAELHLLYTRADTALRTWTRIAALTGATHAYMRRP